MKTILKRLVVLGVVAAAVWWVWSHRDRIAVLSNSNVRIQGEWHPVEMEFNEPDTYTFTEGIISKNGYEWGTYVFRKNTQIEVTVRRQGTTYELEFPDDDSMVWLVRSKDGDLIPSLRWRR
jgi:hypothetical protein